MLNRHAVQAENAIAQTGCAACQGCTIARIAAGAGVADVATGWAAVFTAIAAGIVTRGQRFRTGRACARSVVAPHGHHLAGRGWWGSRRHRSLYAALFCCGLLS